MSRSRRPPREVRPDGTRDPVPKVEIAKPDDPAETVGRIIANSKTVGDRLAAANTGTATRSTQDRILKDIDSLIDQQENPPPSGGGSDDPKDQNPDQNNDQKPNDKNPSGGMNDTPPKDGTDPGGMPPPNGGQQANTGRRPRRGSTPPPDPTGKTDEPGMANTGMANTGGEPQPGLPPTGGKQPGGEVAKGPKGGVAGGGPMGTAPPPTPSVPLDDEVVKEVWGHLPDQLRQQVTQYYKEQFMPKYADLLKQYYSSLANTRPDPRN